MLEVSHAVPHPTSVCVFYVGFYEYIRIIHDEGDRCSISLRAQCDSAMWSVSPSAPPPCPLSISHLLPRAPLQLPQAPPTS